MNGIATPAQWLRLLLGLLAIYAVLQASALALGSDRGQAGLIVGALVVAVALAVERVGFGRTAAPAARAIGLGRPRLPGVAVSVAISLLLVLVVPISLRVSGSSATLAPDWLWLLPGLFAQAGIAEEVLFRGYLFGHLRRERSFWRAAALSTIPFVAVHLLLFASMPWPVALAALLLSVVTSFPLAHLFELGGSTIWAPALLHFVIQAVVKVVVVSGEASSQFPVAWMAASAVLPMLALAMTRPTEQRAP
jgi:membrane protease YdiL (CAAX protease family)